MNLTTAVFLINSKLRAVAATYDPQDEVIAQHASGGSYNLTTGPGKVGKRTLFKTLDQTIKKDDYVVVPTNTRHGMTVVKIIEVDVTVDFDDQTPVNWIISKLDLTEHANTLKMEAEAIEEIKKADFKTRRDKLADALFASDKDKLKDLPLYKNGEPA